MKPFIFFFAFFFPAYLFHTYSLLLYLSISLTLSSHLYPCLCQCLRLSNIPFFPGVFKLISYIAINLEREWESCTLIEGKLSDFDENRLRVSLLPYAHELYPTLNAHKYNPNHKIPAELVL